MILVVNLNLTVDRIMEVHDLQPGVVHRAEQTDLQAGGKGVNVARTLRALDVQCELVGLAAGRTGEYIDARLEQEGIRRSLVRVPGESRTSVILLESATGRQTVINERGPTVLPDSVSRFFTLYTAGLSRCEFVVLTGSVPPGAGDEVYARLIAEARQAGRPTLLDAAGEPLRQGVAAGPAVAKPNQAEAGWLCDCEIASAADARRVAAQIMQGGAGVAAITLGREGMVVAGGGQSFWLRPPAVEARNAVGSGDAAAAGFAAGQVWGWSLLETARLAVACGTASARHGFGRCSRAEVESVKAAVEVAEFGAE